MVPPKQKPVVGLIGFGRFGQLTASVLSRHFPVKVYRYKDQPADRTAARRIGVELVDLYAIAQSDIVILAVPISRTRSVIKKIAPLLKKDALVIDACSVKTQPCRWLKKYLPSSAQLLGTHPMFGQISTKFNLKKQTWNLKGLQIVLCPLRLAPQKLTKIKQFLTGLGLEVIETKPEDHDRQVAVSQALIHFIGRSALAAGVTQQEIYFPGFSYFLKIMHHARKLDPQVSQDMQQYNPYTAAVRDQFLAAATATEAEIKQKSVSDQPKTADETNAQKTLAQNRQKIDQIDAKIVKLLEERYQYAEKIGRIKQKEGIPVVNKEREQAIIKKQTQSTNLDPKFVQKLFRLIFQESYQKEK